MNATMEISKENVQSVEGQGYQMPTTVKSVQCWKKIEMAVQRLSIQVLQKQTCFMNGKNTLFGNGNLDELQGKGTAEGTLKGLGVLFRQLRMQV